MTDKAITYGQVTVSEGWSSTIVLPIEEAAELAQLIAKGRMWAPTGSFNGYYAYGLTHVNEDGKRPALPTMQVLDQAELEQRLAHGERCNAARIAEREEEARKEQAKAAAVNSAAS